MAKNDHDASSSPAAVTGDKCDEEIGGRQYREMARYDTLDDTEKSARRYMRKISEAEGHLRSGDRDTAHGDNSPYQKRVLIPRASCK